MKTNVYPNTEMNNPERLTINELKAFPGCEHYTDEQATEIIETIYQLALVLFNNSPDNNSNETNSITQTGNE